MKLIKIKVLSGDSEIVNKILHLEQKEDNMLYVCKKTGLEIVDCWDELYSINTEKFINSTEFYNTNLFCSNMGENLQFITSFQYYRPKEKK